VREIPTRVREVWVEMRHPRQTPWNILLAEWMGSLAGAWMGGMLTFLALALLAQQSASSILGVWIVLVASVLVGVPLGVLAGQLVWVLLYQGTALFIDMLPRGEHTQDFSQPRSAISREVSAEVVKEALATPDGFQAWLKGKPPDAVVGYFQIFDESILANFLWEESTIYVIAGEDIVVYREKEIALPPWSVAFHHVESEEGKRHGRELGDEWTASEAVTMLAEALRLEPEA